MDTRGTMFFEIARIAREKQPRLLLLENVKGLLSHDQGRTFTTIISTLDELGYDAEWQVLNSKNFGVPQNRERVFIVGHLRGTGGRQVFPIGESNTIDDQVRQEQGGKRTWASCLSTRYGQRWTDESYVATQNGIRKLTPIECERLQGFPDNWTKIGSMSNTQRYKMCGNAVTVNVTRYIITKLLS